VYIGGHFAAIETVPQATVHYIAIVPRRSTPLIAQVWSSYILSCLPIAYLLSSNHTPGHSESLGEQSLGGAIFHHLVNSGKVQ